MPSLITTTDDEKFPVPKLTVGAGVPENMNPWMTTVLPPVTGPWLGRTWVIRGRKYVY